MKSKNIIITTDFSDNSYRVINSAKKIATQLGGKIYVIHVVNNVEIVPSVSAMGTESAQAIYLQKELLDAEKERSLEKLNKLIEDKFADFNGETSGKVLFGDLENELNDFINTREIAFLLIASEGDSDLFDKILGSNALHIMRELNCPVITFPKGCNDLELNNMVYAVSPFHNADLFEDHLIETAKTFKSNLTYIHAEDSHYELYEKKGVEIAERLLDCDYVNINLNMIDSDEPFEAIKNYVQNNPCDLLCLVSHTDNIFDKLFHKSIVDQALNRINKPILCYNKNNNL